MVLKKYDGLLDRVSYYFPILPHQDEDRWRATVAGFKTLRLLGFPVSRSIGEASLRPSENLLEQGCLFLVELALEWLAHGENLTHERTVGYPFLPTLDDFLVERVDVSFGILRTHLDAEYRHRAHGLFLI